MRRRTAIDGLRRLGTLPPELRCGRRLVFAALSVAIVGALLLSPSASAIDATCPARLRLMVVDDGQPLVGARIRVAALVPGWPQTPEVSAELTTDAVGEVVVERQRPETATEITWTEAVQVDSDGYLPASVRYVLFPGAQADYTIRLEAACTTRIRLRGPHGEPLPRVELAISYVKKGTRYTDHGDPDFFVTDEQGECLWRHGKLEDGFQLSGRPDDEKLQDAPVVTVTYREGELPSASRRLQGKLLNADGSIAAGWLVARKVRFIGGYGMIMGPMWNQTQVEDLERIGSDGRFEVDAGALLVVVSPDGTPILYPLDPHTWPPGDRQVTLRLPEVRHVHQGVIVDEGGQPMAGLRIDAARVGWDGRLWEFIAGKDAVGYTMPLWEARADDGTAIGGSVTDAQGRYSVTRYFGSMPQCRVHSQTGSLEDWDGLGRNERNVWRRREVVAPEHLKDVTLVFDDEQGHPVPRIRAYQIEQYSAGKQVNTHLDWGDDSRGQHVFVDRAVDRLRLKAEDGERKWLPTYTVIDVAGANDQVVHVTLYEIHRLPPLAGRILDPDDKPVPNAHVFLYKSESGKRDRYGNDYLRLRTETNEQGEFFFEAAPHNCYIEVRRSRRLDAADSLPGWTQPLAVDQRTRDVVIRLDRGGSVKALLPAGMDEEAVGLFLQREDASDETPGRLRNVYFARDAETDDLLSDIVRPGWYRLSTYRTDMTEAMAALGTVRVEVKMGEEGVLDLRSLKPTLSPRPEMRRKPWTTVTVKDQEQVVSGAEVAVYAAVARPEDLTRWLQQSQGDGKVRHAAIGMLKNAGALTVDALRAAGQSPNYEELLEELKDVENDGWHRVVFDLSDDRGMVRCEVEAGRNCVAVARLPGRLIGWRAFVANGQAVTVDLLPARTLVVRRNQPAAGIDGYSYGVAHIRLEESMNPGLRGLMSALCHSQTTRECGGWVRREAVFDHQYLMENDGAPEWSMEDVPVGAVCTVTLPPLPTDDEHEQLGKSGRITIEPGDGVQTVEW